MSREILALVIGLFVASTLSWGIELEPDVAGELLVAERSTSSNCTLYELSSGDTCNTVAFATNTTYAQLLAWNSGLNLICSNLNNFTSVCISNPAGNWALPQPTTTATATAQLVTSPAAIPSPTVGGTSSYCGKYYLVEPGNDCGTIELAYGIDLEDFLFLNPEVWANCTNLLGGYYYCVEAVGFISTYSGYLPTTTTSAFTPTTFTALPNVGDLLANFSSTAPVIPLANGSRLDCTQYLWLNDTTNNSAADCWSLGQVYGIASLDFVLWNPSLQDPANTTTDVFTYPCTLSASSSYCVALISSTTAAATTTTPPSPRASGEVANCTNWWAPQSFNTCTDVLALYGLTIAELYALNPSVNADCTGMALGTYYCVSTSPGGIPAAVPFDQSNITVPATTTGTASTTTAGTGVSTPSPHQTGLVSDCDLFYYVVPNDSCYNIALNYTISLDDFYAWNPAVGTTCADLEAGEYVCVGVSSSSSGSATPTSATTVTGTATTTSTGTGVVTPTPTQSGMVSDCDQFYDVASGDTCFGIAQNYSIALTTFYGWNPAVNTDCSGLEAFVWVCVGISA